jgi:hypothetical protein
MEATGLKMMNFIKITEDFWIGEIDDLPKQAREMLKEEFSKRGITVMLLGRWEL